MVLAPAAVRLKLLYADEKLTRCGLFMILLYDGALCPI
jgi:hypothetical protein